MVPPLLVVLRVHDRPRRCSSPRRARHRRPSAPPLPPPLLGPRLAGRGRAAATRWHRRAGGRPRRSRSRGARAVARQGQRDGAGEVGDAHEADRRGLNARTPVGRLEPAHRPVARGPGSARRMPERVAIEAEHRARVGELRLDGQVRPGAGCGSHGSLRPRPSGLKPNGARGPRPGQRDAAAVAAGVRRPRSGGTSGPGSRRPAGRRPPRGPARRPGRCTATRAGPPRAVRPRGRVAAERRGRSASRGASEERERGVLRGRTASPGASRRGSTAPTSPARRPARAPRAWRRSTRAARPRPTAGP